MTIAAVVVVCGWSTACARIDALVYGVDHVRASEAQEISESVRWTVQQYTVAAARLDTARTLGLVAGDTAFEAILNSTLVTGQAAFAELVRASFSTTPAAEPQVDSIRVVVLNRNVALARLRYREARNGDTAPGGGDGMASQSYITYALMRRKDGWKIVYQHIAIAP